MRSTWHTALAQSLLSYQHSLRDNVSDSSLPLGQLMPKFVSEHTHTRATRRTSVSYAISSTHSFIPKDISPASVHLPTCPFFGMNKWPYRANQESTTFRAPRRCTHFPYYSPQPYRITHGDACLSLQTHADAGGGWEARVLPKPFP